VIFINLLFNFLNKLFIYGIFQGFK
jgi:hypothetical protein